MRDAARGEDAARGDGQVSGRAGGADIAGGRVGDGDTAQGAVEGDVIGAEAGIDAQDVAEGGRADVGGGGIACELDDTVGGVVSAELAVADEELGLEAGRQAVEEQLTGYAEVGRASDVQSAARIGEEGEIQGREGERGGAAGLGDLGVTVEASWTGELIGAGAGGDVVESAALHGEGRGIPESGRQGGDDVIDGHRGAAADHQSVTDGGAKGVERAGGAGDGRRTALHEERGDGIGPGEVELARATVIDLAGGGSAAVDHGAGEVRGAGAAGHEDTSGTVVRDIESTEIKGGAAGQVVEDPAVVTPADRRAVEGEGLVAAEGDGIAVEDDAAGTIRAGKGLGHRGLDTSAVELQAFAGAEGGGLGETERTLLKDRVAGVSVRRTGHLEVGVGGQDEVELGHAAGLSVLTDRSVPERRAEASEVDALSRGGGSGREVSESAVDGQQSAAFQVIGESLRVVAGRLSHRTREGHGVLAAEDRRGVVGQQNGLGGAERATVGEDPAVANGDAAGGGADAVSGEAEHAAAGGQGAGEGIGRGRIEHPDAAVILGHTEDSRASADFVGQHGGDHVHVGIRAAELEGLGLSGDVRAGSISRAVQHVGQDEGARTTGVDTTGTGRASQDDLTGDGLTRAHVSERRSLAVGRITDFKDASGEVGTQAGRRGAGGADGGDHEVTITQDSLAGVGIQSGQEQGAPTLLAERAVATDDTGDGREIEAGVAVVSDDQVTPTARGHRAVGDGDRSSVRAGGRVLADRELRVGLNPINVSVKRNVGAGDHLADREVGGRAGIEADVGVAAESQRQGRGGGRDGDLEVTPDLEVGDRGARVQAERTAAEEVGRAGGITPDRIG